MDSAILQQFGLTETQVKAYRALVQKGPLTPPEVAEATDEKRSTIYMALDKMDKLGLVHSFNKERKLHYRAQSPVALKKIVEAQRKTVAKREQLLDNALPELMKSFYEYSEQPGVRFFVGKDEITKIYLDQVKNREPIYIIRPHANMDILDFEFMSEIRHMARKAGIKRYAITPDRVEAPKNFKDSDPHMLLDRTWMKQDDYTVPVEWNAYGNKVAIMSFGDEAIGMIIDSPQIAEALRQLYRLLEAGLRARPDYNQLPKLAQYMGSTPTDPHYYKTKSQ